MKITLLVLMLFGMIAIATVDMIKHVNYHKKQPSMKTILTHLVHVASIGFLTGVIIALF